MTPTFPVKARKSQCHQILELQNRDRKHSFTDAVVRCKDGFFRIHHGILRAGSSLSDSDINATSRTVEEMSTVVFLFYLEQSRATFHGNHGPQYFEDQLHGRLEALGANPKKVVLSVPLDRKEVRGSMRNSLLIKMSDSLNGKVLRFTRTGGRGNDDEEFFISTDGNITPVPALEPFSPSAPAPADANSSEDGSRIENPENLDVSSPTLCSCGARINRERISSPYDSSRVVLQPMLPPAPAPADSSCGVSRIGQPPENLDVPSPTLLSVRIEYETNPPPSDSCSYGNNSNGVEHDSFRNPRRRRRSEEQIDRENISPNPNKRPRRKENRHKGAPSLNRGRPLAPLINIILPKSHNSHQGPRHACKINLCEFDFDDARDLLRHTQEYHGLFKLRHYRLRAVPQCLICNSRSRLLHATPEDFTNHVYECLQSKRGKLGTEWEPPLQRQKTHYTTLNGTTKWYKQLEDSPTSFTQEEYNLIMQEDSLSEEEDESDDSLLSSPDPEESAENVSETTSDTEDEDDLCLQIVTEDIAHRVLNSKFKKINI